MQVCRLALILGGIALTFSGVASAHFTLVQPASWVTIEDGGKGAPPCGEGPVSNVVTRVQGGHPLTLKLIETVIIRAITASLFRSTHEPSCRSIPMWWRMRIAYR